MRGENDRASFVAQFADQFPEGAAGLGIEACRRLVEEDDFRVVDQREGQGQALLLAAAHLRGEGGGFFGQAHLFEQGESCWVVDRPAIETTE